MESPQQDTSFWGWLLQVDVPNVEAAREGRFFNTLLVVSFFVALAIGTTFIAAEISGALLEFWRLGVGLLFSGALLALTIFCLLRTRRGHVQPTIQLYIWLSFLGFLAFCLIFDGYQSVGWLLFFWPVALAGTFLDPADAVRMSVGVLVFYGLVALIEWLGLYTPPIALPAGGARFLGLAFGFIMLVATGGVINYLNVLRQREALARVQNLAGTLEEGRRDLELHVGERTSELQARAEQLQTIAELSRATSSILDLDQLLNNTVRLISERLGYYHTGIFLVAPDGDWAVLRVASSEGGARMLARGHRLRVGGQGIVGYVAQTGSPRIATNVGADAVWFNNPDLPETQSEVALPLTARGQIIGVLDIQTRRQAAFSAADVEVLRILADSVAVAIANTRSLQETRAALDRLAQYQEQDTFMAWRQALARRSMQIDYQYVAGMVSAATQDQASGPVVPAELSAVTAVRDASGRYVLLAPLRLQERTLGVLSFERPEPWSEDDIQLTQFVVEQLSLALDNARLLEQTRLTARQERARSEIVAHVRALSTTDAILRTAAEELGRALKVDRSRIQLLSPGESEA